MSESAQELLKQGIAAAQAGQKEQARQLLQQAVRIDPKNELTWLWLSSVAKDNQERIFCLRQLLQINPQNEMARKGLRALGVAGQPAASAPAKKAATQQPGVPMPNEASIVDAHQALDRILAEHGAPVDPDFGFEWVHKTRGRIGERSATYITLGIGLAVFAVVAVVLVGVIALVGPSIAAIGLPTSTPTPPPFTATPTATPGPTNTPSPTPRISATPSATYRPEVPAFEAAIGGTPTVTPVPFATPHGIPEMERVVDAYIQGDYEAVPALARTARGATTTTLLDSYFYEGMALARTDDLGAAESVVLDGLSQGDIAMLNAALGYIYFHQGRYDESAEYNIKAMEQDVQYRLNLPVMTQVDIYLARGQSEQALDLINGIMDAVGEPRQYDVNLIVKRGEVQLARGQYDQAIADARLALYIDVTAEDAYLLAIETDMAMGQYGQAVLDVQAYQFYHPDSPKAWALMGEARYGEGNLELALAAYERALAGDASDMQKLETHLSRARMYMERGLYPQAFEDFDSVLDIDSDNQVARQGHAISAFNTGDYSTAQRDLEILLEEEPEAVTWLLMRAEALVYLKEYDEAEEVLNTIPTAETTPAEAARIDEFLGRVYYHQAEAQPEEERDTNLVEQAEDRMDQALAEKQTGWRAYYRGLIYELAGEPENARPYYGWVLAWNDIYGFPFAVEASDRLEAIDEALAEEAEVTS